MALQMQLDTLDGMDEATAKLYTEKGGKFVLDVDGHVKNEDTNMIPKSRLDQEILRRKESIKALENVCNSLIEAVPEDKRSIIPDLPPAKKIAWLQNAFKMDFFGEYKAAPLDTKRPGDQKPTNHENLNPMQLMSLGYQKSK